MLENSLVPGKIHALCIAVGDNWEIGNPMLLIRNGGHDKHMISFVFLQCSELRILVAESFLFSFTACALNGPPSGIRLTLTFYVAGFRKLAPAHFRLDQPIVIGI